MKDEVVTYYPESPADWRAWLQAHHILHDAVWVVFYKKDAQKPTLTWAEAVSEALCFGWIDSVKKKLDEERSVQFFSKRKAKSTWSKVNKDKVAHLIAEAKMANAGLDSVALAKENGSWTLLDTVEALELPKDLIDALNKDTKAMDYFEQLSKTNKKMMLQWLVMAKRPETRQKRISEIATLAAKGQKPKHIP